MKDIKLTKEHDLDVSQLDFTLIDENEQVAQQLLIKLKLWMGEWFLNEGFGTPYLQKVLGRKITYSGAMAAIRKSINEVDDVVRIMKFRFSFSNFTRKLKIDFSVLTKHKQTIETSVWL